MGKPKTDPNKPLPPKATEDLRFTFTPYTPGQRPSVPAQRPPARPMDPRQQRTVNLLNELNWVNGKPANLPPAQPEPRPANVPANYVQAWSGGAWLDPKVAEQVNTPADKTPNRYLPRLPKWLDFEKADVQVLNNGQLYIKPDAQSKEALAKFKELQAKNGGNGAGFGVKPLMDNVISTLGYTPAPSAASGLPADHLPDLDEAGGFTFNPGELGKDWSIAYETRNGKRYQRIRVNQIPYKPEPPMEPADQAALAQGQQFGLPPGDPNTTLRGFQAKYLGGGEYIENGEVKTGPSDLLSTITQGASRIANEAIKALPGIGAGMAAGAVIPVVGPILGGIIGGVAWGLGQNTLEIAQQAQTEARLKAGYDYAAAVKEWNESTAGKILNLMDAPRSFVERSAGVIDLTLNAIGDKRLANPTRNIETFAKAWDAAQYYYDAGNVNPYGVLRPLAWVGLLPEFFNNISIIDEPGQQFADTDMPRYEGGAAMLSRLIELTNAGATPEDIAAYVASTTGAPGVAREFISGFILDPLDKTNAVASRLVKGYAVTHSPLLLKAIELGESGDVTSAYRAARASLQGGATLDAAIKAGLAEWRRPGAGGEGLAESFKRYRNLLLTEKVLRPGAEALDDFTRLERLTLGDDFIRYATTGEYVKPKPWQFWKQNPKSTAISLINEADTFLQTRVMHEAQTPEQAIGLLRAFKSGDFSAIPNAGDDVLNARNTLVGRFVQRTLDVDGAEDLLGKWQANAPAREALGTLEKALGAADNLESARLVQRLAESEANAQQALDGYRAATNADLRVDGKPIGAADLSALAKSFTTDSTNPRNAAHFKALLYTELMTDFGRKFVQTTGIKPPRLIFRMAAATKAVSSVLLLAPNPQYLVNNFTNGFLMMGLDGVLGLQKVSTILNRFDRLGIDPVRLRAGVGQADLGDLTEISADKAIKTARTLFEEGDARGYGEAGAAAAMGEIRKATQTEGVLSDIQQIASRISGSAFSVTKYAQELERFQSANAVYRGFMQMWNRTWREGAAIPKMPRELEAALAEIDPALPDAIRGVVRAGYNLGEITDKIFTTREISLTAEAYTRRVADALGLEEQAAADLLRDVGVLELVNEELGQLKKRPTPGDVRRIFEEQVTAKVEQHITDAQRREIAVYMDRVRDVYGSGDTGEVSRMVGNVLADMHEVMIDHLTRLDDEYEEIGSITQKALRDYKIEQSLARGDAQWRTFFDKQRAIFGALGEELKKSGVDDKGYFSTHVDTINTRWQAFFDHRRQALREFFDRPPEARTREAWLALADDLQARYDRVRVDATELQRRADAVFTAQFARAYGKDAGERFATLAKMQRDFLDEDRRLMSEFRARLRTVRSRKDRHTAWRRFHDGVVEADGTVSLVGRRQRWQAHEQAITAYLAELNTDLPMKAGPTETARRAAEATQRASRAAAVRGIDTTTPHGALLAEAVQAGFNQGKATGAERHALNSVNVGRAEGETYKTLADVPDADLRAALEASIARQDARAQGKKAQAAPASTEPAAALPVYGARGVAGEAPIKRGVAGLEVRAAMERVQPTGTVAGVEGVPERLIELAERETWAGNPRADLTSETPEAARATVADLAGDVARAAVAYADAVEALGADLPSATRPAPTVTGARPQPAARKRGVAGLEPRQPQAAPPMTRADFERRVLGQFTGDTEQRAALLTAADFHARRWAETTGRSVDEWYGQWADRLSERTTGELYQRAVKPAALVDQYGLFGAEDGGAPTQFSLFDVGAGEAVARPLADLPKPPMGATVAGVDWAVGDQVVTPSGQIGTAVSVTGERTTVQVGGKQKTFANAELAFGARPMFQRDTAPAVGPVWYSVLARTLEQKMGKTMPADQLRKMLAGAGVKADELAWSGFDEWLSAQAGPVSKAEALAYLKENQVQVREVPLGYAAPKPGFSETQARVISAYETMQTEWRALSAQSVADGDLWRAKMVMRAADDLRNDGATAIDVTFTPDEQRIIDRLVPATKAYDAAKSELEQLAPPRTGLTQYEQYTLPGGENYREVLMTVPGVEGFDAPHFGQASKNLLAHFRLDDRMDADGQRVLFVEEIQSDWHQAGREKGYRDDAENQRRMAAIVEYNDLYSKIRQPVEILGETIRLREGVDDVEFLRDGAWITYRTARGPELTNDLYQKTSAILASSEYADYKRFIQDGRERLKELSTVPEPDRSGIPNAPWAKTWHEMAFRRILRLAAEEGYDRVAWTTGAQQAKRYSNALQQSVDRLTWEKREDGAVDVTGYLRGSEKMRETLAADRVQAALGKELADAIAASDQTRGEFAGSAIKISDTGMAGFYDDILVKYADKVGKKWGAKAGETQMTTTGELSDLQIDAVSEFSQSVVRALEREAGPLSDYDSVDEWAREQIDLYPPRNWDDLIEVLRSKVGDSIADQVDSTGINLFLGDQGVTIDGDYRWIKAGGNETVHALDITPAMRESVLREGVALFQDPATAGREAVSIDARAKGMFKLLADGRRYVKAGTGADISTAIHEVFGHGFLYDLFDMAQTDAGSAADLRTVVDWANRGGLDVDYADFGFEARSADLPDGWRVAEAGGRFEVRDERGTALAADPDRDAAVRRGKEIAAHELFARGMERFITDGYAPTPELRNVFARFRQWLVSVYRQIIGSPIGREVPADVRAVYERLFVQATPAAPLTDAPHRLTRDQLVSEAGLDRALRAQYVQGGAVVADSTTTPSGLVDAAGLRPGQWTINDVAQPGQYGTEIAQARLLDPATLTPVEDLVLTNVDGRADDAARYRQWLAEGRNAPPIRVLETDDGRYTVIDGHRRYYAAKAAQFPILALVQPRMEIGKSADGAPLYSALTYEAALLQAYKRGDVGAEAVKDIIDAVNAGQHYGLRYQFPDLFARVDVSDANLDGATVRITGVDELATPIRIVDAKRVRVRLETGQEMTTPRSAIEAVAHTPEEVAQLRTPRAAMETTETAPIEAERPAYAVEAAAMPAVMPALTEAADVTPADTAMPGQSSVRESTPDPARELVVNAKATDVGEVVRREGETTWVKWSKSPTKEYKATDTRAATRADVEAVAAQQMGDARRRVVRGWLEEMAQPEEAIVSPVVSDVVAVVEPVATEAAWPWAGRSDMGWYRNADDETVYTSDADASLGGMRRLDADSYVGELEKRVSETTDADQLARLSRSFASADRELADLRAPAPVVAPPMALPERTPIFSLPGVDGRTVKIYGAAGTSLEVDYGSGVTWLSEDEIKPIFGKKRTALIEDTRSVIELDAEIDRKLRLFETSGDDGWKRAAARLVDERNALAKTVAGKTGTPTLRETIPVARPTPPAGGYQGGATYLTSPTDPTMRYEAVWVVRELDSLVAHHDTAGAVNPAYPADWLTEAQAAPADLAAARTMAETLKPDLLLTGYGLGDGTPIVDGDGRVLSGNARTLALRLAAEQNPATYAAYRDAMQRAADFWGISADEVADFRQPVLVRELTQDTDPAALARLANEPITAESQAARQALSDARFVPDTALVIPDGLTLAQTLRQPYLADFVSAFLDAVPEADRNWMLMDDGELSAAGVRRIGAALLAKAAGGDAGLRLAWVWHATDDVMTRTVLNGLMGSLPELRRSAQRTGALGIADDLSVALAHFADMESGPLTPLAEKMLVDLNDLGHSARRTREVLAAYDRLSDAPADGAYGVLGRRADLWAQAMQAEAEPSVVVVETPSPQPSPIGEGASPRRVELAEARPGDVLPDGRVVVQRGLRLKREAQLLADESGGAVLRDGTKWTVAREPEQLMRHEMPPAVSEALTGWAQLALANLRDGTPGKRVRTESGDYIGQASTYPDFYQTLSAQYGAKKEAVENALNKIITDNGADTGLTVERLKTLALREIAAGFTDPLAGPVPGVPDAAVPTVPAAASTAPDPTALRDRWNALEIEERRALAQTVYGNRAASRMAMSKWDELNGDGERQSMAEALTAWQAKQDQTPPAPKWDDLTRDQRLAIAAGAFGRDLVWADASGLGSAKWGDLTDAARETIGRELEARAKRDADVKPVITLDPAAIQAADAAAVMDMPAPVMDEPPARFTPEPGVTVEVVPADATPEPVAMDDETPTLKAAPPETAPAADITPAPADWQTGDRVVLAEGGHHGTVTDITRLTMRTLYTNAVDELTTLEVTLDNGSRRTINVRTDDNVTRETGTAPTVARWPEFEGNVFEPNDLENVIQYRLERAQQLRDSARRRRDSQKRYQDNQAAERKTKEAAQARAILEQWYKDHPEDALRYRKPADVAQAEAVVNPVSAKTGVRMQFNDKLNGVELIFDARPSDATLAEVRAAGFKWSSREKVWYAKRSDRTIAAARRIAGLEAADKAPEAIETIRQAEAAVSARTPEPVGESSSTPEPIGRILDTEAEDVGVLRSPAGQPEAGPQEPAPQLGAGDAGDVVLSPARPGGADADGRDTGGNIEPARGAEQGRVPGPDRARQAQPRAGAGDRETGLAAARPAERRERVTPEQPPAEPDALETAQADLAQPLPSQTPTTFTSIKGGNNYRITAADALGAGGKKTKYRNNVAAIRLLKQMEAEGRLATPDEQAVLVKYTGWGGLKEAFDDKHAEPTYRVYEENAYGRWGYVAKKSDWHEEYTELKALLTPEEYDAANLSKLNAHYTSFDVVSAMWSLVQRLGFTGGRVLEPAGGSGNFIGLMPPEVFNASRTTAIEMDHLTGRLLGQLYQGVGVHVSPYQKVPLPNNYYDLIISNIPFGRLNIADRDFLNRPGFLRKRIHNYYFAKALDQARPGGLIAFITSAFTLDAPTSRPIREWLHQNGADFVGAIRLPQDAFEKNAGTSVLTDIIVLRKRAEGEPPTDLKWFDVKDFPAENGKTYAINEYFADHPEMMIGTPTDNEMYTPKGYYDQQKMDAEEQAADVLARFGLRLDNPDNLPRLLAEAGQRLPADVYQPVTHNLEREGAIIGAGGRELYKTDGVYRTTDGRLATWDGKTLNDYAMPDDLDPTEVKDWQAREGRYPDYVAVRDAYDDLISRLRDGQTEEALDAARQTVDAAYDSFVAQHGRFNDRTNRRLFADDPDLPILLSLEKVNETTGEISKEPILLKVTPQTPPDRADTALDALVISMQQRGKVDLNYMRALTGKPDATLLAELGDRMYRDPQAGWVTREEYLSGNVRTKLKTAEALAETDPAYARNIEALKAVVPEWMPYTRIFPQLGASWLEPGDVGDFIASLVGRTNVDTDDWVRFQQEANLWTLNLPDPVRSDPKMTTQWGTPDRSAEALLTNRLNSRPIRVEKEVEYTTESGNTARKRVLDEGATLAANQMADKLQAEFEAWLWKDETRRARYETKYNEIYHSWATRQYRGREIYPTGYLPGMNASLPPMRDAQLDAIWRGVQEPNLGLFHDVGAGKTRIMIAIGMEQRRMGLRHKVVYDVPNASYTDFVKQFKTLYPTANILTLSPRDIGDETRRATTMARIASGNYDAIVVPHSTLTMIPVTDKTFNAYIGERVAALKVVLDDLKARRDEEARANRNVYSRRKQKDEGSRATEQEIRRIEKLMSGYLQEARGLDEAEAAKQAGEMGDTVRQTGKRGGGRKPKDNSQERISNRIAKLQQQQYQLQARQDTGLTWEDLGIDQLFVDEAHKFKNLSIESSRTDVRGMGKVNADDSQRAQDLYMKLREVNKRGGGVVFATGTPVSNSGVEMYTMMKYLHPERLRAMGIYHADAWLNQFAQIFSSLEPNATNTAYKDVARFRLFRNGRALLSLLREFADIQTADMLNLPRPKPKYVDVVVKMSPEQMKLREVLADRQKKLKRPRPGEKAEDTWFSIMADGRKMAVDMRLYDPRAKDRPESKINTVVKNALDAYQRTTDYRGTQLIFLTEGVHTSPNLYQDIRKKLIAGGIKKEEIAFIQDYPLGGSTDKAVKKAEAKRQQLFDDVNEGKVRVVFGTYEGLGTGVNVQRRLFAVHEVTVPFKPSEIEQGEGRILRPGNLHYDTGQDVEIYRYSLENSNDAFMWNLVNVKAQQKAQVFSGKADLDTFDTPDAGSGFDNSLVNSFNDPLAIEWLDVSKKFMALDMARKEHGRRKVEYGFDLKSRQTFLEMAERSLSKAERLAAYAKQHRPEKFSGVVGGRTYGKVGEFGEAVYAAMTDPAASLKSFQTEQWYPVATVNGFEVYAKASPLLESSRREVAKQLQKSPGDYLEHIYYSLVMRGGGESHEAVYGRRVVAGFTGEGLSAEAIGRALNKNLTDEYTQIATTARAQIAEHREYIDTLESEVKKPFDGEEDYLKLLTRKAELDKYMEELQARTEAAAREAGGVEADDTGAADDGETLYQLADRPTVTLGGRTFEVDVTADADGAARRRLAYLGTVLDGLPDGTPEELRAYLEANAARYTAQAAQIDAALATGGDARVEKVKDSATLADGTPAQVVGQPADAGALTGEVVALPGGESAAVTGATDETLTVARDDGRTLTTPIDPGVYPTPPQATADSRPVPLPDTLSQLWTSKVRGLVDQMKDLMAADAGQPQPRGLGGREIPADTLALLDKYLGQVGGAMGKAKQQAMRWGEIKRDAALLNYSDRRMYNEYLSLIAPYEFFTTRSMAQWALRALDHPSLIANYLRTQRLLETAVTGTQTPTRLQGQARIPMPFLPDWMGDAIYFNPLRIGLPLQSFTDPWTNWGETQAKIADRATKTLMQWADDEQSGVSEADALAAIRDRQGAAWDKAVAYVKSQDTSLNQDALDLGMSILSPHLPLKWALDSLRGKQDQTSPLPITKYVRALSVAAGVGGSSGINLEEGFGKANGLPVLDQWADYRIDREMANLAAEGALKPDGTPITVDEVKAAMISREGVVYEMAAIREAQQSMLKALPLGMALKAEKPEDMPAGVLSMALVTLFGQGVTVLPEGEQTQRDLATQYRLFKAAYDAEVNGGKSALTAFLADHPAYEARLALYDKPEERLSNFLVDKVWEKYQALPLTYKQDVQQAFGQEFQAAFLNKLTRDYDAIPPETLARWARTLGTLVPGQPATQPLPVQWTDPATTRAVETYYREREQLFDWPAVSAQLGEYYDLDPAEKVTYQSGVYRSGKKKGQPILKSVTRRSVYLDQHPDLGAYFDWSSAFKKDNPGVQAYLDESAALRGPESPYTDSQWTEMGYTLPQELTSIAQAWIFSGRKPNATALKELTKVWTANGKPGATLERWIMQELGTQW